MTVTIAECDPRRNRGVIIDTVARFVTPQSNEARFQWMYLDNPAGLARVWLARVGAEGTVIGMASAFPRRLMVQGCVRTGWVLGDFCMAEEYRSLGPSVKLQRACLTVVEGVDDTLCYDFPSQSMMAVYRRLGIAPFRPVVRWAKPLRVNRKMRALMGGSVLSAGISALGNSALRLWDAGRRSVPSVDVSRQSSDCDAEFAKLGDGLAAHQAVALERSSEYLNWRYRRNPLGRTDMLTARRFGRVVGYAVYAHQGDDAVLIDLFGEAESDVAGSLVASLVAILRRHKTQTLSAYLIDGHPLAGVLAKWGFQPREMIPFVVHAGSRRSLWSEQLSKMDWRIMAGDRDT